MRVLHLSTAKSWRGGEQQITYLVEGLKNLGHNAIVMCPADTPLIEAISPYAEVITYIKRGSMDLLAASKLSATCKHANIDIIHGHDAHAHNTIWLAAMLFGLKTPCVMSRKVDFAIKKRSFKKYNHPIIKAYICVSNAVKEVLENIVTDKSKLQVVHDGVSLSKFQNLPESNFLRSKYNISTDQILIANIAAIAGHKDYFTFVDTAEKSITAYGNKVTFLCIGADGGELQLIKDYIVHKNLESQVIITGFVQDIYKYIGEIDIFLFTSKMEALGSSLLDVMASNVPIVATKAGGIPEIITHQQTGLLADIKDATTLASHVAHLIENTAIKNQLIVNASQSVKAYDIDSFAEKTLNIYQKVVI